MARITLVSASKEVFVPVAVVQNKVLHDCNTCRSIGVFDKNDTVSEKEEREEEEHRQGIAKHDVFGMSIKAKDVGDDGDVRAMDTNMQVRASLTLYLFYHRMQMSVA